MADQPLRSVSSSPPSERATRPEGTRNDAARPIAAITDRTTPPSQARPVDSETITPPVTVPPRIARLLHISIRPLPEESFSCGRISGRIPYLDGLKSAA